MEIYSSDFTILDLMFTILAIALSKNTTYSTSVHRLAKCVNPMQLIYFGDV